MALSRKPDENPSNAASPRTPSLNTLPGMPHKPEKQFFTRKRKGGPVGFPGLFHIQHKGHIMDRQLFNRFENGKLVAGENRLDISAVPWNEHKEYKGVFLKNIVTGNHTQNRLTCHLVRIEPGRSIGNHTHVDSIELHEVIAGSGTCVTGSGDIPYSPGVVTVLPENTPHKVLAGENGLCLFAKFITRPT